MNKFNRIHFLFVVALLVSCTVYPQSKIVISKPNGKTLSINNGNYIGLTTKKENVPYKENGKLSYELYKISKDSLVLRKPSIIRDSIVDFTGKSGSYLKPNWIYLENLSKAEKVLYKIAIVDSYEYKTVITSEITAFQFPPKIDEKRVGCIFCIFIPVYNLFYIAENKKYYKPQSYDLRTWNFRTVN